MIQIDETQSLVYNAAFASTRSVQFHFGIGYTLECYVQIYFKSQKHSQMLWGDAGWHRGRLADIVMRKVG